MTVCAALSLFVHVTVVPFVISSLAGFALKPVYSTVAALAGAGDAAEPQAVAVTRAIADAACSRARIRTSDLGFTSHTRNGVRWITHGDVREERDRSRGGAPRRRGRR